MNHDELLAFLRARLDEREAVANAARLGASGRWRPSSHCAVEVGPEDADWPESATDGVVVYDEGSPEQIEHIALNDPAYVLADIGAERRIIDRYEDCLFRLESPDFEMAARDQVREYVDFVLPLLALPFASHPDYREEWRP